MTTVISGSSPSITFSDSTTQTTAFTSTPSVTTITTSSDASISGLTVGKGGGAGGTNTAIGQAALSGVNTNTYSVAVGHTALQNNTSGGQNTAVGGQALVSNVSGSTNTAVGFQALQPNTASNNTAVGGYALNVNTSGTNNTALGMQALGSNTTSSNNTAVGYQALYSNTTAGSGNTGVGYLAGYSNSTGDSNVFFGYNAGRGVTGSANTCIGNNAGYSTIAYAGSYSILIGSNTDANGASDTNELVLGYNAKGKGSNTGFISMGNVSIYQGNNSGSWATTSDQRIKKNIIDVTNGLSVITALRPVEFDYKENDKHEIGFIAQEYQQILPDQIVKHAPNDAEKEWVDNEVLGIQPNLLPYLVKAIQELKTIVDTQAAEIAELKAKVA